ncbi:hypothetical protein DdX_15083 [Ditylenchus destructor]|uniref:Uncharacterized protein n=1 Tax=Ditylenchus destructor TaxID=166010 RepID=A0AAD4R160_9BILA|nr:hypothetical protein DdX_15083 [Ditylenchus destructor]
MGIHGTAHHYPSLTTQVVVDLPLRFAFVLSNVSLPVDIARGNEEAEQDLAEACEIHATAPKLTSYTAKNDNSAAATEQNNSRVESLTDKICQWLPRVEISGQVIAKVGITFKWRDTSVTNEVQYDVNHDPVNRVTKTCLQLFSALWGTLKYDPVTKVPTLSVQVHDKRGDLFSMYHLISDQALDQFYTAAKLAVEHCGIAATGSLAVVQKGLGTAGTLVSVRFRDAKQMTQAIHPDVPQMSVNDDNPEDVIDYINKITDPKQHNGIGHNQGRSENKQTISGPNGEEIKSSSVIRNKTQKKDRNA